MSAIIINPSKERVFQDVGSVEQTDVFISAETTTNYAAYITPVASQVISIIGGFDMNLDPARQNRQDSVGSASVRGTYDRVSKGSFSIPMYVVPGGTLNTAPEDDLLLKSLMGVSVISTTGHTWTFNSLVAPSFNIHAFRTNKQQAGLGAFCANMACTFGADLASVTYNGFYREEIKTGNAVVGTGGVGTTSNFIAYDGGTTSIFAAQVFDVDSRIKFYTGRNGTQSTVTFVIDSLTPTTGVVSMTASTTISVSVGVKVGFIQPSGTYSTEQPIAEVSTMIEIDLNDTNGYQQYYFTTASLNVNQGWDLRTNTSGGILGTGIIRTQRQRNVTGSITLHDREPYTQIIGRATNSSRAVNYNLFKVKISVGTVGAKRRRYIMPACQFMRPTNPSKTSGEEDLTINFVATWLSADNDELSINEDDS